MVTRDEFGSLVAEYEGFRDTIMDEIADIREEIEDLREEIKEMKKQNRSGSDRSQTRLK